MEINKKIENQNIFILKSLLLSIIIAIGAFSISCTTNKKAEFNLVKVIPGEQQIFWYDDPEDYELTPLLESYLSQLVSFLKEDDNPYATRYMINLEGHSDGTGTAMENALRADLRVNAVIEYLTENGIPKEKIGFKKYSNSIPYSNPNTEEGKKLDRRVVIRFNIK